MGERQQSRGAYPWPIEPSVLMSYDTSTLEEFLIAFCKRPPPGMKVRTSGWRLNTVLKVTSSHMVRFGGDTTRDGALNQQKAYEVLNPSIIKVPRVLHYFERNRGYLLMEYFDGEVFETLNKSQIDHVVHALGHMATTRGEGPASLCGGKLSGLVFEDPDLIKPGSIDAFNNWVNQRAEHCLSPRTSKWANFGSCTMVLCHLGLVPRSLLWPVTGPPCLLEWEGAAFLPRLFQFVYHRLAVRDLDFHHQILAQLDPLTLHEQDLKKAFDEAWSNTARFYL